MGSFEFPRIHVHSVDTVYHQLLPNQIEKSAIQEPIQNEATSQLFR